MRESTATPSRQIQKSVANSGKFSPKLSYQRLANDLTMGIYCKHEEIGSLDQKKTDLHVEVPPIY